MRIYDGISPLIDSYDAYIFDIWGVIHDGVRLFPGVIECLTELKKQNKDIVFLTNASFRAQKVVNSLGTMGLSKGLYDHIISSGESVHHALRDYKGQSIFCFDGNSTSIEGLDLIPVYSPEEADIGLISSISTTDLSSLESYKLILEQCLNYNLTLICANPDLVVDLGGKIHMMPGSIADLYEKMGGNVEWHGKPHYPVYEWAHELLGNLDKSKILAVGDSIRTDVAGANNFGIDVLWNAGFGVHRDEITTDGIIDHVKVDGIMTTLTIKPTAILNGLKL